jgi:hypothetical protein
VSGPISHTGQKMRLLTPLLSEDLTRRFWQKVDKTETCWNWTSSLNSKGYGQLALKHYPLLAHRLSYAIHRGEPGAMYVLHRCDNPRCVNPDHLFLGTVHDNNRDMFAKGRARGGGKPGEGSHNAVLTNQQVLEIRARYVPGRRGDGPKAARKYGVSVQTIHRILRRQAWSHL